MTERSTFTPTAEPDEHCATCDPDGRFGNYDWFMCIGGEVYGPCEHEMCGGVCEMQGRCDCACHAHRGATDAD